MVNQRPHDRKLYVKTTDYQLWDNFAAKYGDKKSGIILKLIRLHMEDRLYHEDGRKVIL